MRVDAFHRFQVLSGSVFVVGVGALICSWLLSPPPLNIALALLVFAALLAEGAAVLLPRGYSVSLSFPLSVAAALLLGPTAAAVVALASGVSPSDIRERVGAYVMAFNTGQTVLTTLLSGWLYLLVGGRTLSTADQVFLPLQQVEFPHILGPIAALGLTAMAVNLSLVGWAQSVKYTVSLREAWSQGLVHLVPIQVSLSIVAVSIAQVMSIQLAGLLLFVFPLVISRQVHERYVVLKQSYVDTVRSLVAALEAKDRYTVGHSERVARYAVAVAKSLGLPDSRVEQIELAAQLHDLGKVGIPGEVLAKPGRLTADEFEMVREHPEVGANLIARVPGLAHLAPIVRFHHERHDGNGYCTGLAGHDIPLDARIMAAADSFDAMTSSRAYRAAMPVADAIVEMNRCSGTQFDPEIVKHLVACVQSVMDEDPR